MISQPPSPGPLAPPWTLREGARSRAGRLRAIAVVVLLFSLGGAKPVVDDVSYHNDAITRYDRRVLHGFTVLVSQRLLDQPDEAAASLRELDGQLDRITRVVPAGPLEAFRQVTIWLERAETAGLGEFHAGPEPLVASGRNPAKSRCVVITNARHLVEWAPVQPWAVLHELAHSYHFLVLGEHDPALLRAYDQAMKSGRYDLVKYGQGGTRVAYAKQNPAEYFAELAEAYFGKNDFEPATRAELQAFDPAGYQLMVDVWGAPAKAGETSGTHARDAKQ